MNPLNPGAPPEIAWPALAAVVLLAIAATAVHWWLRKRGLIPTAGTNPIKLVASRSLGGKRSVAIVEVDAQRFLLGMTDEVVSLLSQLPSEAKATVQGSVVAFPLGASR